MLTLYFLNNKTVTSKEASWFEMMQLSNVLKMTYLLPNNRTICLEDFEKYLYFKEEYKSIFGCQVGGIDTINLFGKYQNKVYQFSLKIKKGKAGQVINDWGKEFRPFEIKPIFTTKKDPKQYQIEFGSARTTNHNLWINGVLGGKPKNYII